MINYTLIISHYNMPTKLERLIKSLPMRQDLQVIVVDDCSNKQIEELNQIKLNYNWIEWYNTERNSGAGRARNIGLKYAKGKSIIFADSDDYFNLSLNAILDKYIDNDFDIIYSYTTALNEKTFTCSSYLNYLNNQIKRSNNDSNKIKYKFPYPWSKIVKLKLILENKIEFEESKVSNDVKFSTLCDYFSKRNKIESTAFYCYMVNDESVSRHLDPEKTFIRLKIDAWRWNFIRKQNIKSIKIEKILGPVFDKLIQLKERGINRKALKIFKEQKISIYFYIYLFVRARVKRILTSNK